MIGLLRAEQDDDIRVRLARGLALYGTEKAVAVAREVVAELRGDAERGEILDILCAQEVARGVDNDETRRHLFAMERGARERQAGLARFERLTSGMTAGAGISGHTAKIHKIETPRPPARPARPAPPKPPVGRNEPCPCGSGKKFKKCCG